MLVDVLRSLNESFGMNLDLLNVTKMTAHRKDGHISVYYFDGPASLRRQDCSHWCLPGVPDSWNELLYALFMKRQNLHTQNLTGSFQARL
uniref:Uncharacterized protein MANES_01G208600 n=1 Tax=Rhizophora mucronata TaxID=61149 RepID=A0A2P2NHJ9_RHIMU